MQAKTQILYAIYALIACAYAEQIHNDWREVMRKELAREESDLSGLTWSLYRIRRPSIADVWVHGDELPAETLEEDISSPLTASVVSVQSVTSANGPPQIVQVSHAVRLHASDAVGGRAEQQPQPHAESVGVEDTGDSDDERESESETESSQQTEEANRIDHRADRVSISYTPRRPAGDARSRLSPESYGDPA